MHILVIRLKDNEKRDSSFSPRSVSQSQQAFYCRERKKVQIKKKFVSVVKKKLFYIPLNPCVL